MFFQKNKIYVFFLVAFAVLNIGVVFGPELDHSLLPLEVLGHYRLQVSFIFFILFLGLIVKRHYILAVLQFLFITASLSFVFISYSNQKVGSECLGKTETEIRVLVFNLYHKNDQYNDILDEIKLAEPDIILMEEVKSGFYHFGKEYLFAQYPFRYTDIERGIQQGKALFSKYPIIEAQSQSLNVKYGSILRAQLDVEGSIVNVIGVHTSSPQSVARIKTRNLEIQALQAIINEEINRDEPLIVAGDFNITPWHPVMRVFKVETGLNNNRFYNILPTWPSWLPFFLNVPIDHIFYSNNFTNSNYFKGLSAGSDHFPIYADLRMCKKLANSK